MLGVQKHTPSTSAAVIPVINTKATAIRDIVVPLTTHSNAYFTNSYALSMAGAFSASIKGFAFAFDPIVPVAGPMDGLQPILVEELIARSETEAHELAMAFEHQAQKHGVNFTTELLRTNYHTGGELFASLARQFDISVVPQAKGGEYNTPDFAGAALFGSGRPVVVVPFIQRSNLKLTRVVVCWDGSRAAARAVADAWPLLDRASSIDILTIGSGAHAGDALKKIGEHFAQHGVTARLELLGNDTIDSGNAILSYVSDVSADLIVMGGYGHSKMREWVLGGVTRTILQTMTVPTLISH